MTSIGWVLTLVQVFSLSVIPDDSLKVVNLPLYLIRLHLHDSLLVAVTSRPSINEVIRYWFLLLTLKKDLAYIAIVFHFCTCFHSERIHLGEQILTVLLSNVEFKNSRGREMETNQYRFSSLSSTSAVSCGEGAVTCKADGAFDSCIWLAVGKAWSGLILSDQGN